MYSWRRRWFVRWTWARTRWTELYSIVVVFAIIAFVIGRSATRRPFSRALSMRINVTTTWQLRVIYVYYCDDVAYCMTIAAGHAARCFAWGWRRESRFWWHCSSSTHQQQQQHHHRTIYIQYLALFRWNWMKNGRTWLRRRVLNVTPTCRSSADARATAYTRPLADVCSMTIRFETLSLLNDVHRRLVL